MLFNDETYENEKGAYISKNEIDCLGTYEHMSDGFFKWNCGNCGKVEQSRAYRIGGIVFVCRVCGKKSLLVRTDIRFLNQMIANAQRNDTSAEKAIKKALVHLGQGISELGRV